MIEATAMPPKRVGVEWQTETDKVIVGLEPRTVLQVRAIRDCQITFIRVHVLDEVPDLTTQIVVCEQLPASGKRMLRVRRLGGPARIVARQDLPGIIFDGPELAQNAFRSPDDFWVWTGAIEMVKGCTVSIVVATSQPARCKVIAAGF